MTIGSDPEEKPRVAKLPQKDMLADADAQAARPAPRASGLV